MKKSLLRTSLAILALGCAASISANPHAGILISASDVEALDFQEHAAAKWFTEVHPDGEVIAPGETSKIDAGKLECIWIHIDRCGIGLGNLPAEFSDAATIDALKKFVADGGNLLLTKQATQLLTRMERIDNAFAPGIYGDGDGGEGFDDWTLNAQIGWWQLNPDNQDPDATQYYDRRNHAIYEGLATSNVYPFETFPMEGTGNPDTSLWREDHNCLWDLNAYNNVYTVEGPNTVVKFENQNNAVVLGTWGHVQDYAVAGIVEFLPQGESAGRILANGLAACEWAPRSGVNLYHDNLTRLTSNSLNYLMPKSAGIEAVDAESISADAPAQYFNLQGMAVNADNLLPGVYVIRQGSKTSKVLVR